MPPGKAPGEPKMTPLGAQNWHERKPRERKTNKSDKHREAHNLCVLGWAMKATSTLGLHFASPLRLLGSKGLGGMREAKTI